MAIEIRETFQVEAPAETVWRFIMDPHMVVTCMPGAQLDEVIDASTFLGSVKVKVGAITTTYKGRIQFTQVDDQAHVVQMTAEGRETGGGMAKGTMSGRVRTLPGGQTEVVVEANVDITGRIMQVGRGMIQGVAHQLFLQFVARMKERVPASQETPAEGSASLAAPGPTTASEATPIRVLPLVLKVMWSSIVRFFRRLFGRTAEPK
ncbi:MAG TPA: SRPBCC family protein [Candidatus Binatia bacterium]